MNTFKIILIFFLLGVILHFIPSIGTPLHSDVNWIFRLQTAKDIFTNHEIPPIFKSFGAYPHNFISFLIEWKQLTGRFNYLDVASFRIITELFGANADYWRLSYILFVGPAVGFFYLICKEFDVVKPIRIFLSLGLMLFPLDIWTNYMTAEPKAVFFLMLALLLLLKAKSVATIYLSALLVFISFLFKETFIFSLIVIPGFWYWRFGEKKQIPIKLSTFIINIKSTLKKFYPFLLPYLFSLIIFISYVLVIKVLVPNNNTGYPFETGFFGKSIVEFTINSLSQIIPIYFSGLWIPIGLFIICSMVLYKSSYPKKNILKSLQEYAYEKNIIIFLSISFTTIFTIFIYFLSSRDIIGRYGLPSNFLVALLTGIIFTIFYKNVLIPLYNKKPLTLLFLVSLVCIWPARGFLLSVSTITILSTVSMFILLFKKIIHEFSTITIAKIFLSACLLIFSIPHLDTIIRRSIQNREDQRVWHSLIQSVSTIPPRNSLVSLKFQEPLMIETAESLWANVYLNGRSDLMFYLEFEDNSRMNQSGYITAQYQLFNNGLNHKKFSKFQNILYVKADRKRKKSNIVSKPKLNEAISLMISNPQKFLINHYALTPPYLNIDISLNSDI